jgi:hypothetical protein
MTVKRIFETPRYSGESSDTKPTDALVGARFWEKDTKNTYIVYDKVTGVAQWVLKG